MAAPTSTATKPRVELPSATSVRVQRIGRAVAAPLLSVLFAFAIGAVVVLATGGDPLLAYSSLICGGFGLFCSNDVQPALQISFTIAFATPLILTGLAVAVAFRAGLFNIGAAGQFILGATAATVVGVRFAQLDAWLLLPLVLLAGVVAGAAWGGIVGVLKATTGAHEVVTTIMLNYIAQKLLGYLINGGPLQLPQQREASPSIADAGKLPKIIPADADLFGLRGSAYAAHTGIFVALLAAAFFAFLLHRTALGYEIRAVGQSQRAARYAGISVRRTIIASMLLAGAFAGLAGAVQIAGVLPYSLTDSIINDSSGFDGIAVALLGQTSGIGVALSAIFFGSLHAGGPTMQTNAHVSPYLVGVLQALVLFSVAANFVRTLKLRLPGLSKTPAVQEAPAASDDAPEPNQQDATSTLDTSATA
jgi:general nucleoside transport system permease protein